MYFETMKSSIETKMPKKQTNKTFYHNNPKFLENENSEDTSNYINFENIYIVTNIVTENIHLLLMVDSSTVAGN